MTVETPGSSEVTRAALAHVAGLPFFEGLPRGTLEAVVDRMVPRSLPRGYTLFRKGEQCRGVYVLTSGQVEIYRATSDGREQVLHVENPVQTIAELPFFDSGVYPAAARTTRASTVLFLSLDDLQRLYRHHPEVADAIIQNLGRRLRALVTLVEKISLKSVPARVAATLLEIADRAGSLDDGGSCCLPSTHTELAHQLATSRESVARAFAHFRAEGWIEQEGRRVTLCSVSALEREAEGEPRPPPCRVS